MYMAQRSEFKFLNFSAHYHSQKDSEACPAYYPVSTGATHFPGG
jgi:hypothetical protein